MALIIATTLPVATIAAFLAWHSYQENMGNSLQRTERDAHLVVNELKNDIDQTEAVLRTLAGSDISQRNALQEFGLVQTISRHRYCSMMLTDIEGHPSIVLPPPASQRPEICNNSQLIPSFPKEGSVMHSGVTVLDGPRGPLVRFIIPTGPANAPTGYIVAIRTLGWQRRYLPPDDNRLLTENRKTRYMLAMPGNTVASLFPDEPNIFNLPSATQQWLRESLSQNEDTFLCIQNTTYVLKNAYGPASLLVSTERTDQEKRALNVFLVRVGLIAVLLMLELIIVAWAANVFLVEPLERLTSAVFQWRRTGGPFDSRIHRAIPQEIRHLERAFLRATRRLSRHQVKLEQAARDQEISIREIHHRVKNNLQVVVSLLNLQASRIRSHEAREEFHLVRDRVRALATLHRYLYSENALSALDLQGFLEELCAILFSTQNMHTQTRIRLELDVERILISPDQAVPIALIVTEVVSNALRYAFPDKKEGIIRITLHKIPDPPKDQKGLVIFELGDNGIGLEASKASESRNRREGIGLQLIKGFARQINAELVTRHENGTWYSLTFLPADPSPTAVQLARRAIYGEKTGNTSAPNLK